jgi:hypothetical protein
MKLSQIPVILSKELISGSSRMFTFVEELRLISVSQSGSAVYSSLFCDCSSSDNRCKS